MTLEELYRHAIQAKEQTHFLDVSLYFKNGYKKPAGFPRGELLNETEGGRLYAFNADKIITWVKKQPAFNKEVVIGKEI